jgi:hypothetical protein
MGSQPTADLQISQIGIKARLHLPQILEGWVAIHPPPFFRADAVTPLRGALGAIG